MVTFLLVNPEREASSIAILVSFNGRKYRRSTGESAPVKLWNNKKKRVKIINENQVHNSTNSILDRWESAAIDTVTFFKEYYTPPTPKEFFAKLDEEFYVDDTTVGKKHPTLFIDYLKLYKERYSKVRSVYTVVKYQTAITKIEEYEAVKKKKLTFEDIDIKFYNNFQEWFYKNKYSDNYFGAIIKIIKQAYREARDVDKLHKLDGISHKEFITVSLDTDNIYLTEQELLKIHNLAIDDKLVMEYFGELTPRRIEQRIKILNLVRDRFLIGAYTGLRVSDFGRLREMNVSNKYIRIKTTKTGSETVIPIHPIIRKIFDHGFDPQITVSDQKINAHIKDIAKMAMINEKVLINRHKAGKVEQLSKEKWEFVCTHTARRSFATNAYKSGVPTIAIMKITGHTKESTFLKYIKISAEENAEMLYKHPFFAETVAEPEAEPNNSKQIKKSVRQS